MFLSVNGRLVSGKKATISALDSGFLYGDGFFDTLRVSGGVVLFLREHMKRLHRFGERMRIVLPKNLESWILAVVSKNRLREARLRVSISRGNAGLRFPRTQHPTVVISAEKFFGDSLKGIAVRTLRLQRLLPGVKTLALTSAFLAAEHMHKTGASEVIFIDHRGRVTEGSMTNVFVVRGKTILTPRSNLLPGITRGRVLKIARAMGFKVRSRDFGVRFLRNADEVFLTNCVRGIVPVVAIDGKKIRKGTITAKLLQAYREYIARQVRL